MFSTGTIIYFEHFQSVASWIQEMETEDTEIWPRAIAAATSGFLILEDLTAAAVDECSKYF